MTVALFDTAQIGAVAAAIRAKTGKSATMTVAEMPAEIDNLLQKDSREVWLSAMPHQNSLVIDTGVASNDAHHIQVIGYANIYSTSTLVAAKTSSTSRQGVNLLSTQNAIRVVWGDSGLKQFNYDIAEWSAWQPMVVSLSKYGMTLKGFSKSLVAVTKNETFTVTATGTSTANYEIFPNITAGSTSGQPGCFRRLWIKSLITDALLHDIVPIMHNDFSLALLDKITGNEIALATGESGYSGMWNPSMDAKVNTILGDGDLLTVR